MTRHKCTAERELIESSEGAAHAHCERIEKIGDAAQSGWAFETATSCPRSQPEPLRLLVVRGLDLLVSLVAQFERESLTKGGYVELARRDNLSHIHTRLASESCGALGRVRGARSVAGRDTHLIP